jgi:hypothetical protein
MPTFNHKEGACSGIYEEILQQPLLRRTTRACKPYELQGFFVFFGFNLYFLLVTMRVGAVATDFACFKA